MKKLLITAAICTACSICARAQNARETLWWGATPTAVHDSLARKKYWRALDLGATAPNSYENRVEAFVTDDREVIAMFTYLQNRLIKRSFVTQPGTNSYHTMQAWIARSKPLADGSGWLDTEFSLYLERKPSDDGIIFTIEPDWDNKEAQKLSK